MPFASINCTNPRINSLNFGSNCSAFGCGWKTQFFWVGHFEKKITKEYIFFAFFPFKLVNIYRIARMGQNFDGFQQIPGMPILLQHSVLTWTWERHHLFYGVPLLPEWTWHSTFHLPNESGIRKPKTANKILSHCNALLCSNIPIYRGVDSFLNPGGWQ